MASALPIVLLAGGALLLASGKKKRRRKKTAGEVYEWENVPVPPTKPPIAAKDTSGPSGKAATSSVWKARQTALAFVAGMKVCNCHPGKVDGIFGPATIAAIIAFQICAGITPDGKWGPQTDGAMKKMLADIARGQVKVAKPASPKSVPKIGPREVGISPDYTQLKIGSSWTIAVLDKFLEKQRESGQLITDPKGIKFWDLVLHDPSQFLGELVGLEGKTAQAVGYGIYGALWLIATQGIALEAIPAAGITLAGTWGPTTLTAMEMGALFTTGEAVALGAAVSAHAAIGTAYPLWKNEVMAATGLESIAKFMRTHQVTVGSRKLRIDQLPHNKPATQKLNKVILNYVYNFQVRTFEG